MLAAEAEGQFGPGERRVQGPVPDQHGSSGLGGHAADMRSPHVPSMYAAWAARNVAAHPQRQRAAATARTPAAPSAPGPTATARSWRRTRRTQTPPGPAATTARTEMPSAITPTSGTASAPSAIPRALARLPIHLAHRISRRGCGTVSRSSERLLLPFAGDASGRVQPDHQGHEPDEQSADPADHVVHGAEHVVRLRPPRGTPARPP